MAKFNIIIAESYENPNGKVADPICMGHIMDFLSAQADTLKQQSQQPETFTTAVNRSLPPIVQFQSISVNQAVMADKLSKVFNLPTWGQYVLESLQNILQGKDTVVMTRSPCKPGLHHLMASVSRLDGSSGITLIVSPSVKPDDIEIASLKESSLTVDIPRSGQPTSGEPLNCDVLYITRAAFAGCEKLLRELFTRKLISKILLDSLDRQQNNSVYQTIATLRHACLDVPMMVITSKRKPLALNKIANDFLLREWTCYSQSTDPGNLRLCVSRRTGTIGQDIVQFIHSGHQEEHGLFFCHSGTTGKMILMQLGNSARYIHDNLNRGDTERTLRDWHSGKFKVLVLTNDSSLSAIYRPDIRFVIHDEPPEDLETYYDHACLAGGDGKPAHAILYYSFLNVTDHSSGERHRRLASLRSYCRNESQCRRVVLLQAVDEAYTKKCNLCDVCNHAHDFIERDFTREAREATALIQELGSRDKALQYCQEVFAGRRTAQVRNGGDHESVHFGAGSHLPFVWIEQLFEEMYLMNIWRHSNSTEDWDNLIVEAGPAVSRVQAKSFQFILKIRDVPQPTRHGTPPSTLPLYRDDSVSANSSFREETAVLKKTDAEDESDCSMKVFSRMKALRQQVGSRLLSLQILAAQMGNVAPR
ncbi:hypothetical protein L218DRAFT_765100 [Marasmius fiardii PR-910]|nr:hypothetical protein L218DRAFT_765100 [Marasmius fiardii PR-910]